MATTPLLRERERSLAAIERCIDAAVGGQGSALLIIGEAGLGKTSLFDRARQAARAAGMEVGSGRGEPMEGTLPFGVVVQSLRTLDGPDSDEVLEVLGAGGLPSEAEPGVPYYRTARWLVERGPRPLLLAYDDLQWADPDSLALLAFLARRITALRLPVALIGTLRPWPPEAEEVLAPLDGQGRGAAPTDPAPLAAPTATFERLHPLSRAASDSALADWRGADVADEDRQRTWELCQGNPLLVAQVASALSRGEHVPHVGGHVDGLGRHLLLARFAGLDRTGLACARAGCVLGTSFRGDLAAEVAGIGADDVVAVLEGLWANGLVTEADPDAPLGGGVLRFVHPLFAQALYEDIAPPVRQRLHARAFEVLAGRGLTAEAAEHAVRADLVGDDRAVAVLVDAARSALRSGAVASAVRLFEAADRFSAAPLAPDVVLAHARALSSVGRSDDAAAATAALLERPDLPWSDRVEALRAHGRTLYMNGAPDHGDGAFAEAVELAVAHDPARAVQPLLDHSLSAWLTGGPRRALPLAVKAKALARHAEPDVRERADAAWGHLTLEAGDAAGLAGTRPVVGHLDDDAESPALAPSELVWPWASVYQLGMSSVYAEHFELAEQAFSRAAAITEEAGAASALANVCIHLANVAIRTGRLELALADAERARQFVDLVPGIEPYVDLALAEVLVWMGRLDESEPWCKRAAEVADEQWFARLWLAHVAGLRCLWVGDDRAVEHFLVAEATMEEVGIREPCHMVWGSHAVTAHLAAGSIADAERVTEWLASCSTTLPCRYARVAATLGRARIADRLGHADAAEARFLEALAGDGDVVLPLLRIETTLAFGQFLRRIGRPTEARPHLAEAAGLATTCGAELLATTATTELNLAGGRRRRPRSDPRQITDAERRVARLAAEGRSNPEIARALFLSVNTVETHLKRVYAKLGIRSRQQLRHVEV